MQSWLPVPVYPRFSMRMPRTRHLGIDRTAFLSCRVVQYSSIHRQQCTFLPKLFLARVPKSWRRARERFNKAALRRADNSICQQGAPLHTTFHNNAPVRFYIWNATRFISDEFKKYRTRTAFSKNENLWKPLCAILFLNDLIVNICDLYSPFFKFLIISYCL